MHTKRKAKFMIAGGVGSLVVAITLLLLVLPATNPGSISSQAQPPEPGGGRPEMPVLGMPSMGGMGFEEEVAEVSEFAGDPFESSRPNPFQARAGVELEAIENIKMAATTYGPNWAEVALASRIGLVPPDRRPERKAEGVPEPGEKEFMRISGVLWTAGKPLAIFETADGGTGSVRPGDVVDDWLVEQIGQDYVLVRNMISGVCQRVLLKTR